AVLAFAQGQLDEAMSLGGVENADLLGFENVAFMVNAFGQGGSHFGSHLAGDGDAIFLLDAVTGVGELDGEVAVVRVEDQAFAVEVEAADRKKIAPFAREKV